MASNSFNNNTAKADPAYARELLRDGLVPSFLEMVQRPAYALHRVPHDSCRAVANLTLYCSSAHANLMRVIDHVQNSVPRASREIRDLELEELNGILTQEPCAAPAAQQDESRVHTDAPVVELGDPSTNAALPTPPRPEFQSPMQQHPISGPVCTAATRKRFVVAMCCCPLGSILCIHAAKDTSVVTRSSCFSARKGRIQRSKERRNAEHAVLDGAVELATNEWNALGVTDMRVSPFVHALRTPFVHGCPVYFLAGAGEFSCRGS